MSTLPCPACLVEVEPAARRCPACGRGIATLELRADGRTYPQRVACAPEEVELLDGRTVEVENPEEIPGREA